MVNGAKLTSLPEADGAKLPLSIAGPYFSSLASDDIVTAKYWIMICLGVGFTGCGSLFSKIDTKNMVLFHRSKGVYAKYIKTFCKEHNILLQPNPGSRNMFWQSIKTKIASKAIAVGPSNLAIVYCGNVLGLENIYELLEELST
eukprot:UN05270